MSNKIIVDIRLPNSHARSELTTQGDVQGDLAIAIARALYSLGFIPSDIADEISFLDSMPEDGN